MKKLILAGLVALAACGGAAPEAETPATPSISAEVTLALAIAEGIENSPASVDSVLLSHRMTRAGLDSLLFRIAEDSSLSAQYVVARR